MPWQSPEVVFGARNTAVYFALHSLGAKTVLLSLMATVSALPYTLFTLPTGSVADMVDRKKILLGVQFWHATMPANASWPSLEKNAFDKLRNDRSDLDLHVPLLSGYPRMHRHVLYRELNFDGQTPQFHNLA